MTKQEMVQGPIFFERNRVGRIYTGGKLFADFFGDAAEDGFFPEEWVCSSVEALNEGSTIENEGLSVVRGSDVLFKDLLREFPCEMLGERKGFSVLVKLLDSAVRLPIQAHPDKAFSKKHFNSDFGKSESWLIVETRENACLYFGFKDKMTKEEFRAAVKRSYDEPDCMEPLLNRIRVKKGEVYIVPAKMVHAIGAGCLILETQEPTDFTIQPEAWCAGNRISEQTMYMGLDEDIALDVFNYDIYGEDAVKAAKKEPITVYEKNGVKREILISYNDTPCFAVGRITVEGGMTDDLVAPAIYIVTKGSGTVHCNGKKYNVNKGDYFFAPHSIKSNWSVMCDGKLELIECLPNKE